MKIYLYLTPNNPQAVSDRAFSATAWSNDQHLFSFIDGKIDIMKRRRRLTEILKAKVFKLNDWFLFHNWPLMFFPI